MDSSILDVVLGLGLIYLVLALLVSKVQETWGGQMRAGRSKILHDMVMEAVGHDRGLHDRIFASPIVFALSEGDKVATKAGTLSNLWTATGPSAIPPTLFARALLIELYNDGKHNAPRDRYNSPRAFIEEKAPQAGSDSASGRVWGTMRSLSAGCDGNWDAFEAAIAQWFADIGDRADGWYRRTAQNWSLVFAFVAAVLLNVDSFALAERLSNEPVLRRALATLAQQVNTVFPGGQDAAAGTSPKVAPALQSAALRADEGLQRASALLSDAYFRNDEVAKFDPNRQKFQRGVGVQGQVETCARADASGIVASKETEHLSNPSTWVGVLPPLRAFVKQQRLPTSVDGVGNNGPDGKDKNLRVAYRCITNLVGWIGLAEGASNVAAVQTSLRGAAAGLDQAADALLELIDDQTTTYSLASLFQADPSAFQDCARQPGVSVAGLRRCANAQATQQMSLPIGHTERNRRIAFCMVIKGTTGEALAEVGPRCGGEEASFIGKPELKLAPMVLVYKPWLATGGLFLLGCLVTALFVALGAPFWFDVLGRVVKLRAAGTRRDPEPIQGVGAAGAAKGDTPLPDPPEPFPLARNVIEQQLLPSDIVDMQTGLGITPTGVLDRPTRVALAARAAKEGLSSGEEVSLILFNRVVGAHPAYLIGKVTAAGQTTVAGTPLLQAQALADKLMDTLNFKGRIASPISSFGPDLRALSVLYQYKKDRQTGTAPQDCKVVKLAKTPGALDEISEALLQEMLALPAGSSLARESAAWMDWAIGELGQFEAQQSDVSLPNPRVVKYLQSVDLALTNPIQTAWCAAFVSWVLANYQASPLPGQAFESVIRSVGARDFGGTKARAWGTSVWKAGDGTDKPWNERGIQPGDIVTTRPKKDPDISTDNPDGISHVAFVLAVDASGIHALGGNQNGGKEVCVSRFPNAADDVVEVRRPPMAGQSAPA